MSGYGQEVPQSQITDNPWHLEDETLEHGHRHTHKKEEYNSSKSTSSLFLSAMNTQIGHNELYHGFVFVYTYISTILAYSASFLIIKLLLIHVISHIPHDSACFDSVMLRNIFSTFKLLA